MPDSVDTLIQALKVYGFSDAQAEALAGRAWDLQIESPNDAQYEQWIFAQPEFESRFPGLNAMRQTGRAPSAAEWVQYEKQAVGMLRGAGIPPTFWDTPEDIGRLITNEVSLAEVQQRVAFATEAAANANQGTLTELQRLYGVDPGEAVAFFLDPDKAEPLIAQRWAAAKVGNTALQTGFGTLDQAQAERVGGLTSSVEQARQGFAGLAQDREVFGALDRGEQAISTDTALDAQFAGNAESQAQIDARKSRRKATFSQGGGFAGSASGFAGAG
jgi:hypothetical protein